MDEAWRIKNHIPLGKMHKADLAFYQEKIPALHAGVSPDGPWRVTGADSFGLVWWDAQLSDFFHQGISIAARAGIIVNPQSVKFFIDGEVTYPKFYPSRIVSIDLAVPQNISAIALDKEIDSAVHQWIEQNRDRVKGLKKEWDARFDKYEKWSAKN